MIAYKLVRRRKDGTLGPLFIHQRLRIPVGKWLLAEDRRTPGFAHRPGWHATAEPRAPHLKLRPKGGGERVWCLVELTGWIETHQRPEAQGGTWYTAERMRVLEVLSEDQVSRALMEVTA